MGQTDVQAVQLNYSLQFGVILIFTVSCKIKCSEGVGCPGYQNDLIQEHFKIYFLIGYRPYRVHFIFKFCNILCKEQ